MSNSSQTVFIFKVGNRCWGLGEGLSAGWTKSWPRKFILWHYKAVFSNNNFKESSDSGTNVNADLQNELVWLLVWMSKNVGFTVEVWSVVLKPKYRQNGSVWIEPSGHWDLVFVEDMLRKPVEYFITFGTNIYCIWHKPFGRQGCCDRTKSVFVLGVKAWLHLSRNSQLFSQQRVSTCRCVPGHRSK